MAHDLNPAQRLAVDTLCGPLLVLAGAGTGKTRVVIYRIARLIKNGTPPDRILAVTFTKKASAEMQARTAALLGKRRKARPEISTYHSLCMRILRRHIRRLGYPEKFAIYDRGDQESVARGALREIKVPGEVMRPGDLLALISNWKMRSIRPSEAASVARTDKEHLGAMAYRRYQTALKTAGAVDFDDLLLLTEELFSKYAEVRREEAGRFDHLLVDEYQDTNGTQYRIIKALAAGHRNLCVVGDDDQSIYAWRGAEVTHILGFRKDWPEAKIVRLEENYRSTSEIIALANRLIVFNKVRHDKILRAMRHGGQKPAIEQYPDEAKEAEQTVANIRRRLSDPAMQPRDIAILFRTNEQPRAFEAELRKADLPYVLIGGMSFYDRKEVRDVLSYIKLLAMPTDEVAALRIINTPPRGITQKTVATLMQHAVAGGSRVWDAIGEADTIQGISDKAAKALSTFRRTIEDFSFRLESQSPVDVVNDLIRHVRYHKELERVYKEPSDRDARWAGVEEVVNTLATYCEKNSGPTLRGFLDEITLSGNDDKDEKQSQLSRNAIALMTLHSAKGLEFPEVYLVGLEEGILPHHRSIAAGGTAIDEERRLCYVGITRAEERLTMSLALTRRKWGKARDTHPSRFLFELTGQADNPNAGGGPPNSRKRLKDSKAKKNAGKRASSR